MCVTKGMCAPPGVWGTPNFVHRMAVAKLMYNTIVVYGVVFLSYIKDPAFC